MIKITAGELNGQKIEAPDESITRPTLSKVRMSVFNTLFSLIENFEGKSFFDMYAGSGVMGLEAISRGFENVFGVEQNPKTYAILMKNIEKLKLEGKYKAIKGNSLKVLAKNKAVYDVVYIDPPYFSGIYEKSLQLVKDCGIIILEHSQEVDFSGFEVLKQKKYGDKFLTYLRLEK